MVIAETKADTLISQMLIFKKNVADSYTVNIFMPIRISNV